MSRSQNAAEELRHPNARAGAIANPDLRRVAVVGTSGCGKTTFAARLAAVTGGRHFELDALYWLPSWTTRTEEEFLPLVRQAVAGETWVADGNYGRVRDLVWGRATAVVWLDYSFPLVFGRSFRRTIQRAWTKEELFSGNRESFRQSFFSADSILLWILRTYWKNRREYARLLRGAGPYAVTPVVFRKPEQADRFLARLDSPGGCGAEDRP